MTDIFICVGLGVVTLLISITIVLLLALIKESFILEDLDEDSLFFGCTVYIILLCMLVIPIGYIEVKNHPERYGIQFIEEQEVEE